MRRKAFAVSHRIQNAVSWYGTEYKFTRNVKNEYGEPTEEPELVEIVQGIYHSSQQSFIELINTEAAKIKTKTNKGILCSSSSGSLLLQGDRVEINFVEYKITAVEPVVYGDVKVATEISLEECAYSEDSNENQV